MELKQLMNISGSGYYKRLKNMDILNQHKINRTDLSGLIKEIREKKTIKIYILLFI